MTGLSPSVLALLNSSNRILGLQQLPGSLAMPPPPALKPLPVPKVGPGLGAGQVAGTKPWISAVLKGLGAPLTSENVRFMEAWGRAEGGGGYSGTGEGQFNWLNTRRGVTNGWNQANFATGVKNTIGALQDGYYTNIVNALKGGNTSAQQLAQMVAASKWGTGSGVLRTLASVPKEPAATDAGHNPTVVSELNGTKASPLVVATLKLAAQYLGTPYHWGGASPQTGFDCSGFVQWLYAQKGVSLPRTTFQQWKAGTAVKGALRPGDIVFFYPTSAGPDHEGLYIGNGQFIQSPHTGSVIKVSKLSDYKSVYMGARRVV